MSQNGLIVVLLSLLGGFTPALAVDKQVVVVTASSSPLTTISSLNLRKLYFGINVTLSGQAIQAARNNSDPQIYQVFLQTLVSMSEKRYEHRLLTLTTQNGRPRPIMVTRSGDLTAMLLDNPQLVSYMWIDEVDQSKLRVLRILWQEK